MNGNHTREKIVELVDEQICKKLTGLEELAWSEVFHSLSRYKVRDFANYWTSLPKDFHQYNIFTWSVFSLDFSYDRLLYKLERKEEVVASVKCGKDFKESLKREFRTPRSCITNYMDAQLISGKLFLKYQSQFDKDHIKRAYGNVHHILREYYKALVPAVTEFYDTKALRIDDDSVEK